MKKTMLLFVVLALVFSGSAFAGDIGYGAKAGLNMAKFGGSDADMEGLSDPSSIIGMTLGGFVTIPFGESLLIQPEFLFTQKGSKYEFDFFGVETNTKFKMNYLDVPVLVVYKLMDNISVFGGPLFELFLSGKIKFEASYEGESEEEEEDIDSEDVNSLGVGLVVGGTYMVTSNIGIDFRYVLGLTSMDSEDNLKNNGLQIIASYYLNRK